MTTLPRDIQCSQDVGRMAALGKFDREFTVHGCAYRQNGETFYRIYEQADALYHYCETSDLRGLCTTLPQSHTLRTGVPSGTEDTLWQEIKWQLARALMADYPDDYLDLLNKLSALPAVNTALPLLQQWQEQLEGRFERPWLQLFDSLVDYCCAAKLLTAKSYHTLKQWLALNWRQMEDDVLLKDIYERTLHGIAYLCDGALQYKIDAQYANLYRKRQQLLAQGLLVTPIYSQTYWFQAFSELADVKKQFLLLLQQLLPPCLTFLERLKQQPSFIAPEKFFSVYQTACRQYGPAALETLQAYGRQWQCLS